jgi:hypothetical protein
VRAAHKDAVIERGTTWRLAFQLWLPTAAFVAAAELASGDHIMVDGLVQTVLDTTAANGYVAIRFGLGLWSDPALTVKADATFQRAALDTPTVVNAAYEFDYPTVTADDGTVTGGPLVVAIPAFVDESGSILLTLDQFATWALPAGAGQWDVTVQQSSGDWVRALEGQFSAVPTVSGTALPGRKMAVA